jgi:hypothetical protein
MDLADSKNIPVSNFSNEFTQQKLYLNKKVEKIKFEIDHFNLRAMNYTLSLWGAERKGKVFDFIENQIAITVEESDFYETGVIPRRNIHGYLLLKSNCFNV